MYAIWSYYDIKEALSVYESKNSQYPLPTDGIAVTYTWETVWTQWTFWDATRIELWSISKQIVDPLTLNEYTYSVLNTQTEYQLGGVLEWIPSYNFV